MDLASLALAVDSRDVKAGVSELDRLTAAGGKAETATASMGREWVKASSAAGKLRMEEASAAMAAERMAKASGGAGAAAAKMASDVQAAAARATAMGQSTRLAGHHVQNLTFQLNDMVVGLASGQKPMTVFMQQGMQIGQIMQMAGLGVGGFVKQLGLMLVPFTPILAALGAMAAGLALVTHEVNENSKVHVTWKDVVLGTYDAAVASIRGQMTSALKDYGVTSGDVFKQVWGYAKTAFNLMYGLGTLVPRTIAEAWSTVPAAVGEAAVAAANAAIRAMNSLMKAAVDVVNGYVAKINAAIAVVNSITGSGFGMIPTLTAPQVNEVANKFAGAGVKFAGAMGKAFTDTWNRDFIGEGAKFIQPYAEARALKRAAGVGGKAGKAAGAAAGKEAGETLTADMIKALAPGLDAVLSELDKQAKEWSKVYDQDAAKAFFDIVDAANDNLPDATQKLVDAARAQGEWNQQIEATVALLGTLGGFGGTLGAVLQGLTTGNFSGIGGKVGGLLNLVSGLKIGEKDGIAQTIGDKLTEVFSQDGPFGKTLASVFQGAGIGNAIGSVAFSGNKNSQIGSTLGGAAGQAIGGPLGAIAGSLIGGLLGGLLTTVKKASATIGVSGGALGIAGVSGNSNSRKAASTQGANTAIDALNTIAEAFGATLGTANVSIGMRKNSYVVDTTGSGKTKGAGTINFGKDSEAALKAAIADAISDGVFVGLSAGVEKLLKNGDVEKQLQKALSFQSVFDDLASAKDPAKAAQDAIGKWHDSMAKIFEEAGATADELAKLEELTGIKRADAAEAAAQALLEKERPYREAQIQIMQLEGKTAEALAAQRQLELDGMEAGLRPLYQRIYALTDEAEAAQKLADIAAQRHELETQLLEILDPVAGALVRQNDALMALDPSLRDAQRAVWDAKSAFDAAAESAKAAADAIKEAFEKVQANLDQRRALTIQLAELLDPAAAEAMRRADILRSLEDPILQGIQRMIWDVTAGIDAAAKSAADLKEQTEAWQRTLDQRRSLTIQLADILDPAAAEAMRRADTLNALADPDSRRIQQQIFDAMDAQKALADQRAEQDRQAAAAAEAEQARLKAIADARNVLIAAYDRESGALKGTIDKFRGFAESIAAFRESIIGQANPGAGYGRTLAQFRSTSAMAGLGSENALGRFNGDAQALLDAAKDRAGSGAEYRRIQAMVLAGANSAIGASSGVANMAQQQLDTMKAQLEGLIDLNEGQATFTEALEAYRAVAAEQVPVLVDTVSNGLETLRTEIAAGNATAASAQQTAQVAQDTSALALVRIERLLTRVTTEDAVRFTTDETIPVDQI